MHVGVLGAVEVWAGDRELDAGPPRQRCVLAALAVDAGQPVSIDTLVERVWAGEPPLRARNALYVYVNRLRRMLAEGGEASAGLLRRSGGYLLDVPADAVDLHRFRNLVRRAETSSRSAHEQFELLGEALALYRGVPLDDVPGQWAAQVRSGWQHEHVHAATTWAAAALHVGRASKVIGPLAQLAERYPLTESLVAALMRALHAAGRNADALERYGRTRARLAAELGVDPGSELREVYELVLHARSAPSTGSAPADRFAGPLRPAQLPLDVPGFTGRVAELEQLDSFLDEVGEQPTSVLVTTLSGMAGVGKTALAVHWAHRVQDRFPDGQLYIDLRGFHPGAVALGPADAIRGFLDALGVPPQRVPVDLDGQSGLYRTLLAGRRMLLLLDNARDADQVRPLLPGAAGCVVVVTSRVQLGGLVAVPGARPVRLDLLTAAEARGLLVSRLGITRTAAEPAALADVVARCARLPIALVVVAARALLEPEQSLGDLAQQLDGARSGLHALAAGDPAADVRTVFSWSYRALRPTPARLFRLLGLHPGTGWTAAAAASVIGLPVDRTRALLDELVEAHLVVAQPSSRYGEHDLLRAYATELADDVEPDVERTAAIRRLLDHYLHSVYVATIRLYPMRRRHLTSAPCAGVTVEAFDDQAAATAWFAAEHHTLLAVVALADEVGDDDRVVDLAWWLADHLDFTGRWFDLLAVQHHALAATRRGGDRSAEAKVHRAVAPTCVHLRRFDQAREHLERAVELASAEGDTTAQIHAHQTMAWVLEQQGDHRGAIQAATRAHQLASAIGNVNGQARALNTAGWSHALLGELVDALRLCREALALGERADDAECQANTLDSIGLIHLRREEYAEAIDSYRRAIALHHELGIQREEALSRARLGDAQEQAGDRAGAVTSWRQALSVLDDLEHPVAAELRDKLAGI